MTEHVFPTREAMSEAAALMAAELIKENVKEKTSANILLAPEAGLSVMFEKLAGKPDIDWTKVNMFNLYEYWKVQPEDRASSGGRLFGNFVFKTPVKCPNTYFIQSLVRNPGVMSKVYGKLIEAHPIDVALIGIGDKGCLGFNTPPADFQKADPFFVTPLEECCRRKKVRKGFFPDEDETPELVLTISIRQLMKSRTIVCTVSGKSKSWTVKRMLEKDISEECPASILRRHPECHLFLDAEAASNLKEKQPRKA